MEELKIYSVTDSYIEYLRKANPNVYSNKIGNRTHTRKYVGVVIRIGAYNYYIPMSSPKDTDYQVVCNHKVIKKSIVPIIRIVVKNSVGENELKGTLRISHMIPVQDMIWEGVGVLVTQLIFQIFFVIVILQMGGFFPLWFSKKVTKIICIVMAVYLSLNMVMNFVSKSKKEKCIMTPLSFVAAVCFWITALV